jgi:tight adherence protein C
MIYRAIPYALDLGVLVLQAGGTLREVLEQVAKGKGPFADELRITLNEIDSGASQATALKNMSNRVRLEPLDTVVLAINRGEETGAPMAETLATQAELFRERRLQELEKLAVEAPTKMAFPNMLIMLSVLILVIGPLIVRIVTSGMF